MSDTLRRDLRVQLPALTQAQNNCQGPVDIKSQAWLQAIYGGNIEPIAFISFTKALPKRTCG